MPARLANNKQQHQQANKHFHLTLLSSTFQILFNKFEKYTHITNTRLKWNKYTYNTILTTFVIRVLFRLEYEDFSDIMNILSGEH